MTVQTAFYNWQTSPLDPRREPWNRCSPNLVLVRDWMNARWGFRNLGCHVDRNIIVGSSWSDHAYGAAIDQGYSHWPGAAAGEGRHLLVVEVIPFLIANSRELGIQAIHDYHGQRIWRAWRPASEGGPGWKRITSGQFTPGNLWIHVATPPDRWADTTPIAARLAAPVQEDSDVTVIFSVAQLTQRPIFVTDFVTYRQVSTTEAVDKIKAAGVASLGTIDITLARNIAGSPAPGTIPIDNWPGATPGNGARVATTDQLAADNVKLALGQLNLMAAVKQVDEETVAALQGALDGIVAEVIDGLKDEFPDLPADMVAQVAKATATELAARLAA